MCAAVGLRTALEARQAEAALYRRQYEGLCRKLDTIEEHQRQASSAARAKVSLRHLGGNREGPGVGRGRGAVTAYGSVELLDQSHQHMQLCSGIMCSPVPFASSCT